MTATSSNYALTRRDQMPDAEQIHCPDQLWRISNQFFKERLSAVLLVAMVVNDVEIALHILKTATARERANFSFQISLLVDIAHLEPAAEHGERHIMISTTGDS